jgi:hypothetical protein
MGNHQAERTLFSKRLLTLNPRRITTTHGLHCPLVGLKKAQSQRQ